MGYLTAYLVESRLIVNFLIVLCCLDHLRNRVEHVLHALLIVKLLVLRILVEVLSLTLLCQLNDVILAVLRVPFKQLLCFFVVRQVGNDIT